ncbi:hypothetical protein WJ970_33930 [Achromobacter xylosoxidans]
MLIPSLLVLKMAFVDELLRRTEFVKSPSGDGSSSAYSHELAISQKLGLIAMESHIVAVDGKAVLHQILTISFDSGLSDEIANPENHGKVDQVGQLAGELFSPFGAVDVSDLADDGTVTVQKFKPLVSLDEAFALACYRYAVGVFDAFTVPQ